MNDRFVDLQSRQRGELPITLGTGEHLCSFNIYSLKFVLAYVQEKLGLVPKASFTRGAMVGFVVKNLEVIAECAEIQQDFIAKRTFVRSARCGILGIGVEETSVF